MEVTITKCDICPKKAETEDYNEPEGWYRLSRTGDRDKDFWARHRDICDECAEKLNLPKIYHEAGIMSGHFTTASQ